MGLPDRKRPPQGCPNVVLGGRKEMWDRLRKGAQRPGIWVIHEESKGEGVMLCNTYTPALRRNP